jgi:hypothetical protein
MEQFLDNRYGSCLLTTTGVLAESLSLSARTSIMSPARAMDTRPGKEEQTNLAATGHNSNKPEVPREKRAEDVSFAISSLMQAITPHHTDKEHHYAESIPS